MTLEGFAKVFLAQLVSDWLFETDRLTYDWSNGVDPEELPNVPPADISMNEIEDVVGDVFHHEGDRVCAYVWKRLPSDEAKAFFLGPVRQVVAHAVKERCESGEVYKTNYAAREAVIIDGVELAASFYELCKEADLLSREEVEAFYAGR